MSQQRLLIPMVSIMEALESETRDAPADDPRKLAAQYLRRVPDYEGRKRLAEADISQAPGIDP